MANTLNYAEVYSKAVDDHYANIRTSDKLWKTPTTNKVEWTGGKHIKVPSVSVASGRSDRTRNSLEKGKIAEYSNEWQDFVVEFDREWETTVDPKDVDETNYLTTIAKITDTFNTDWKIPEQDMFMYSQLFKRKIELDGANSVDVRSKVLTEDNIIETFDDMMCQMDEAGVTGARHLYVTYPVRNMLKNASFKNRVATMNGEGDITRSIHSLDDVDINPVPSRLMKTDVDFTNGAVAKDSAQQIEMFLIADGVHVAPRKYTFVSLDAPSVSNHGLYDYYENEYADVFIFKNKSRGYSVVTAPQQAKNVTVDNKPADNKSADNKPADNKPADNKPAQPSTNK